MSTLISVIVPCYNQAEYLEDCLKSVLSQTYQNWECIIVNDGSTDNTEAIALKWVKKDERFIYLKKENEGVALARNLGIDKAKGSWILPLDGDDKIDHEYIEIAIEKINEGYDLIYCKAKYFGEREDNFILPDYNFRQLLMSNQIFCSAIFNKEKLKGLRYDQNLIFGFEDWEFWISFLSSEENVKVFCINKILFYYRIKSKSRNQNINDNMTMFFEAREYIFRKHIDLYIREYGDFYSLVNKINNLKKENDVYKKIYNSKRIKVFNKLLSFFKV